MAAASRSCSALPASISAAPAAGHGAWTRWCGRRGDRLVVIARSVSDEAIHLFFVTLDCFASLAMTPVARFSPRQLQFQRHGRLVFGIVQHQRSPDIADMGRG